MFSPDGGVERVYHTYFDDCKPPVEVRTYGYPDLVQSPIFFMVGRATRTWDDNDPIYVTPPPEDGLENWEDASNLWVALNPQTGQVTVAEVYADFPDPATGYYRPSDLYVSRALARQAQVSMGGR